MYDIIIKNGQIIDGLGTPAFKADLAIMGEKIVEIKPSINSDSKLTIDASNRIVCPGFIDIHSHTDATITVNSRAESKIRQGVTTEVIGNCGMSAAPLSKEFMAEVRNHLIVNSDFRKPDDIGREWVSFAEYLNYLTNLPLGINLMPLVGFGTLRSAVMGNKTGSPNESEMQAMEHLLELSLDQGAIGLSTGLEYVPDSHMKTEDLIRLCGVLKRKDKLYATHIRNEAQTLFPAIREAIRIGEESGCKVQISHLKLGGKFNWGKAAELFEILESAVDRGVRLSWDQYPYVAWGTGLVDYLPNWVIEDGNDKMIKYLSDPHKRQEIRAEINEEIEQGIHAYNTAPWENVQIAMVHSEKYKGIMGKRISVIAKELGVDPLDFVFDLLIHEKGAVKTLVFCMDETDIKTIMCHPSTIIASDARALATYGELHKGSTHPRYYGAFPRVLGKYVRGERILSLEEAIKKMTSMPAEILGLKTRGCLAVNMIADVTIFDPEVVIDKATYEDPHQYAVGIDNVLLKGKVIIDEGEHTGQMVGNILSA